MLHIYTGDGKGKTTAATGLLIRALGCGMKCGYFSFLKDGTSSELKALTNIPNLKIFPFPKTISFTWQMSNEERIFLKEFYSNIMNTISKESFDLLILDEALPAISAGLISPDVILNLKKQETELILTGYGKCPQLFEAADYITEMKKIKHPYDKGINARKGIEY